MSHITIEKHFHHNNQIYQIGMDLKTYSRFVLDDDGNKIVEFNSSLNVFDSKRKLIGRIATTNHSTGTFILRKIDGSEYDTQIKTGDRNWQDLLEAEILIAKYIIDQN